MNVPSLCIDRKVDKREDICVVLDTTISKTLSKFFIKNVASFSHKFQLILQIYHMCIK